MVGGHLSQIFTPKISKLHHLELLGPLSHKRCAAALQAAEHLPRNFLQQWGGSGVVTRK